MELENQLEEDHPNERCSDIRSMYLLNKSDHENDDKKIEWLILEDATKVFYLHRDDLLHIVLI